MKDVADVVVVGLGAMGSATVYQLAKRGASVIGIDQFKSPHNLGSTHGDTRITRQAIGEGEEYVPLALRSYEIWRELEKETGKQLLTISGGLIIESKQPKISHGQFYFLQNTIDVARKYDIAHSVLSIDELRTRFPQLHFKDDEWGYYEEEAGFLRPEVCVQTQLDLAEKAGADLHFNEMFLEFKSLPDGTVSVKTNTNEYIAQKLILSAGPWIGELLPQYKDLFKVYRQVMFWFDVEGSIDPYLPGTFPVFMIQPKDGNEFYGFPAVDGEGGGIKAASEELLVTTTPSEVNRDVTDQEKQDMFEKYLRPYLPGIKNKCLKAVSCLYTVTPDSGFVIDTLLGQESVMVASPCSGHGFKHSAAIGEALSQWALEGKSTIDVSAFKFSRFDH
ncbi:MAG: sarcosine oxidase [Parcubacteria group bacterium]|nr:sarcosine oxidase [Parcubacteria group bacterium]